MTLDTNLDLNMRPGSKGFHVNFNSDSVQLLVVNLQDVLALLAKDGDDKLDEMTDSNKKFVEHTQSLVDDEGWTRADDNFGMKVTKGFVFGDKEHRVTLVKTSRGLKLDIREWYSAS